ncbi:MAG: protein disulfide isomerase family protein [Acidobacteriota bacterium]|nr:protein disulfide isomerase family protein [Blastocatellia bacterium]MDW8413232.1 protein disulfide isomerase family protein [Acidobacteriota bacterium]
MKSLAFISILLVATAAYGQKKRLSNEDFYVPSKNVTSTEKPTSFGWLTGASGFREVVNHHKQLSLPMIVYFYTDWCGYCKALDGRLLNSEQVESFLKAIPRVRINPESGKDENELARGFSITGYPSFFVISASGHKERINPFRRTASGVTTTMTPEEFIDAVKTVAYKSTP